MKKCITVGNLNKYYLYIIAIVVTWNIHALLFGLSYRTYSLGFLSVADHGGHTYIHKLLYYLIILISSCLYYLYIKKNEDKNSIKIENNNQNYSAMIGVNRNKFYGYGLNKKNFQNIPDYFVYLIMFLYVLFEHIHQIVTQFFYYGDYWMFELGIMAYLNYKMLNIEVYEHQKLSLILILIPTILKSITMAFLFLDEKNYLEDGVINYKYNNKKYDLLKTLYVSHWWLFPIGEILYFFKMVMDGYIIINIKKFMDFKYVTVNKLLILYGLFGVSFAFIFSLITTFISCGKKNENIYDIYDYICKVVNKNNDKFIENYGVYFTGEYLKDLFFSLIGAIINNIYLFFLFQLIKHLNPIYKNFSSPLIYFIQKIILIYQLNDDESIKYLNASFFLDLASDFFAIISFLIFLEIFELNFCNLNKNLRISIALRSEIDSSESEVEDGDLSRVTTVNEDINLIELEDK